MGRFSLDTPLKLSDWLIVLSTLLGPILAVQAQKVVEAIRSKGERKKGVFSRLMATRAARLSPEHVQVLNLIDVTFYGSVFFFGRYHHQTAKERAVIAAWKEYHDHLNQDTRPFSDAQLEIWGSTADRLFVDMLHAMAQEIGFSFDRVLLKRGSYSPVAHGNAERENEELRRSAVEVFSGKRPLKMDLVAVPQSPAQPAQVQQQAAAE
jgi:hypothetical protein